MDELKLLRGHDYQIGKYISIKHPTVGQICEYNEENYWNMIKTLTATPFEFKAPLFDIGIDYEEVDEFDLFISLCSEFKPDETRIILGDLDLSSLKVMPDPDGQPVLISDSSDLKIDKLVYEQIMMFLRDINGIEKNQKKAGNAITKKIYIEMDKREAAFHKDKPFKSILKPLVSALVNSPEFKYNYETVWNLPIYTFFDAVKRIQKIKNYNNLMGGIYAGTVDGKKVKKELNWLGEL